MGVLPDWLTRRAEDRAERSTALDWVARVGLVTYGAVHLVVAGIAFQLAFSGQAPGASSEGAFALLARNPVGWASLWLIAAGLALLVVWQLVEAFTGHLDAGGRLVRTARRIGSAARAVVYAALGYNAASTASGARAGGSKKHLTAELMSAPAGPLLVGLVGVSIAGVGVGLAVLGLSGRFMKRLDDEADNTERRIPIKVLGKVGYVEKAVAFGAVGTLFVVSAVRQRPQSSGGLDVALRDLLRQPFGPVLVSLVALGIACFGLYCFAWSRHIDR